VQRCMLRGLHAPQEERQCELHTAASVQLVAASSPSLSQLPTGTVQQMFHWLLYASRTARRMRAERRSSQTTLEQRSCERGAAQTKSRTHDRSGTRFEVQIVRATRLLLARPQHSSTILLLPESKGALPSHLGQGDEGGAGQEIESRQRSVSRSANQLQQLQCASRLEEWGSVNIRCRWLGQHHSRESPGLRGQCRRVARVNASGQPRPYSC
jgi:hypothetical protein